MAKINLYTVTGYHYEAPGEQTQTFADKRKADEFAAGLVRIMFHDIAAGRNIGNWAKSGTKIAHEAGVDFRISEVTAENWEQCLHFVQAVRIAWEGYARGDVLDASKGKLDWDAMGDVPTCDVWMEETTVDKAEVLGQAFKDQMEPALERMREASCNLHDNSAFGMMREALVKRFMPNITMDPPFLFRGSPPCSPFATTPPAADEEKDSEIVYVSPTGSRILGFTQHARQVWPVKFVDGDDPEQYEYLETPAADEEDHWETAFLGGSMSYEDEDGLTWLKSHVMLKGSPLPDKETVALYIKETMQEARRERLFDAAILFPDDSPEYGLILALRDIIAPAVPGNE